MSDRSIASAGVIAWRTHHLVGFLLVIALVLVGLTFAASQTDPNVIDLAVTRWLQQFRQPAFAWLMAAVSWFGFAPQTLLMPAVVAIAFGLRRLWVESLWIVGSQAASVVTVLIKDVVHRPRAS